MHLQAALFLSFGFPSPCSAAMLPEGYFILKLLCLIIRWCSSAVLAILGSNTREDLGGCVLRVVWMSLVQSPSLLSRLKTKMLTIIRMVFQFWGEVGKSLKLSYLFSRMENSLLITGDYWALYKQHKGRRLSGNTLICQRIRNSWGSFSNSSVKFSGWQALRGLKVLKGL